MRKLLFSIFVPLFFGLISGQSQALQITLKNSKRLPKTCSENPLRKQFLSNARKERVKPHYARQTLKEINKINEAGLDFQGLQDLTHLSFVTIDNDHSKDLDQAMFIDRDAASGHYHLFYAIADASHFVKPGSSLDREAAKRSFTTYLPGFDIPILPRDLSEDLSSLNPNVKRRAVVIHLELSSHGIPVRREFLHAVIESRAQLSYRGVQEYFLEGINHPYQCTSFQKTLNNLRSLGEVLMLDARQREVVAFPEGELHIVEHEQDYEVGIYERFRVEMYNEQISVIANRAVAEFLNEKGLFSIHRFHPPIPSETLSDLKEKLKCFGRPWEKSQSMGDYMASLGSADPKDCIAQINVCRGNQKAKYEAKNHGHFGLKVDHYDHFTAPMRRYPDIIVHRILLAAIHGSSVPYQDDSSEQPKYLRKSYLRSYAEHCNHSKDREIRIERANNDHVAALLLKQLKVKELFGTIIHLKDDGFAVQLDGHPFESWVRLETFSKDKFELELGGYRLRSGQQAFLLGQRLSFNLFTSAQNGGLKLNLIPVTTG